MSMDRSQESALTNGSSRGIRLPRSQAWQVPTFLVGVISLLAVTVVHPAGSVNQDRKLSRDLATARKALDRASPDIDKAIASAEAAMSGTGITPAQAAEAHFLLGSAYLRRGDCVSPESATVSWELARAHLERAEQLGVSPDDLVKLRYRLGKTYVRLNVELQRAIDFLKTTVGDPSDDAFESYGLLAQAYIRLPQPNDQAALKAVQKQLSLAQVNESKLAYPRLLCGELYRRLDQLDEARKVLARIGAGAPPDILFQARYLRARTLQEQGYWAEAAQQWEQIKNDPRTDDVRGRGIWYALGSCYEKMDDLTQAQQAWATATKLGGEEGQAAALGLAGLLLRSSQPAAAMDYFDEVMKDQASPAEFQNKLIDLLTARAIFETGCRVYLQLGNNETAMKLALLYQKLALPGVAEQLVGQAAEAWGRTLLEQARGAPSADLSRKLEDEARQRFRRAAEVFDQASATISETSEQAELLWRSAHDYLEGQSPANALPVLEKIVALPLPQDKLGEAWYIRGEAFRQLGQPVSAQADYRHCIKFVGRFAYRARYQLALYEIEYNHLEDAETILSQNIDLISADPVGADSDAHEKSLYALANLLFTERDFNRAYRRLEEALERYPNNPGAFKARFQLAQCFRNLSQQCIEKINGAKTEEERRHWRTQGQRWVEMAASNLQTLTAGLAASKKIRPLTRDEENMARQAAFAYAECQFDLGQYGEALRLYEELAGRYHNQVDGLIALRCVWQLHGLQFQPNLARKALDGIKESLAQMPDDAFDNNTEIRTRRWWEEWARDKSRPIP
jgi:tetratricopeptide (TPR) repeat protein